VRASPSRQSQRRPERLRETPRARVFIGKEESSFSEEKEAKRLYPFARAPGDRHACKRGKVFWFFFSKKNTLIFLTYLAVQVLVAKLWCASM
jgi:hypothetical protein